MWAVGQSGAGQTLHQSFGFKCVWFGFILLPKLWSTGASAAWVFLPVACLASLPPTPAHLRGERAAFDWQEARSGLGPRQGTLKLAGLLPESDGCGARPSKGAATETKP